MVLASTRQLIGHFILALEVAVELVEVEPTDRTGFVDLEPLLAALPMKDMLTWQLLDDLF